MLESDPVHRYIFIYCFLAVKGQESVSFVVIEFSPLFVNTR